MRTMANSRLRQMIKTKPKVTMPIMLFFFSALAFVAAILLTGDPASGTVLIAGLAAVASLLIWLRRPKAGPAYVVLDGSNVMHWKDGTPQIETQREVVSAVKAKGMTPGAVFDANAGYKIMGKYQHDRALGRLLDLPQDRVFVVPKGTQADPFVLASAHDLGARIVTNDRFRDWAQAHPEVAIPGHLIRGGYCDGALWPDFGDGTTP